MSVRPEALNRRSAREKKTRNGKVYSDLASAQPQQPRRFIPRMAKQVSSPTAFSNLLPLSVCVHLREGPLSNTARVDEAGNDDDKPSSKFLRPS